MLWFVVCGALLRTELGGAQGAAVSPKAGVAVGAEAALEVASHGAAGVVASERERRHEAGTAFSFEVRNEASFPLNVLALPSIVSAYAKSRNELRPGETFGFRAVLGAYEYHVTIDDGENRWNNYGEAGWGLTKNGVSMLVGVVVGAGITGGLAWTAAVAASAALTAFAAPAAVIVFGAYATLFGVGVFTSMTVSAVTSTSMDFVKERVERLVQFERPEDRLEAETGWRPAGSAWSWLSQGESLHRFDKVVTEGPVREAFLDKFGVPLDQAWMTRKTAEAYFTAIECVMKESVVAKGVTRKFVIAGGFLPPQPLARAKDGVLEALPAPADGAETLAAVAEQLGMGEASKAKRPKAEAYVVEFAPLAIGEVEAPTGCGHADWAHELRQCKERCDADAGAPWWNTLVPARNSAGLEAPARQTNRSLCASDCAERFAFALEADQALAERQLRAQRLVEAGAFRMGVVPVRVLEVHGERALVAAAGAKDKQWVDLAELQEEADGPAFGAAPLSYGRCWARCDADGFRRWGAQVRSLVSTKARCHAAPQGEAHAAFCTHDDQCGPVHRPRKGNERSPGDPEWWECVDPCG